MARGQGKTLRGLAATFGCTAQGSSLFAHTLQKSYSSIFEAPGALAILEAIRKRLKKEAKIVNERKELARYI